MLNNFWTGQGSCEANLHKWGLSTSDVIHIVAHISDLNVDYEDCMKLMNVQFSG